MKLKFKGERFIGAGLVLENPCEVEVPEEIALLLLKARPDLFEEVKEHGKKEEEKEKKQKVSKTAPEAKEEDLDVYES